MKYRPDIDGLRAIAVLSVLTYHAFPALLPGGFTGVDIFFVISGYLISSIIYREIDAGNFRITAFYGRRARRILPALCVVIAATLIFGNFALFPEEAERLGGHAAGAALFVANFVFWSEAGYFDSEAIYKPLLHTWSLAIEEQFYIVWPLLCIAFLRSRYFPAILLVSVLCSFAYSEFAVLKEPSAAFYSPLSRFWELALGGALALINRRHWAVSGPVASIASIAGTSIVAVGLFVASSERFPGATALWPVVGTVLLIAAGTTGLINRTLLSARPVVWVGKISYSLYLWHWPIISYVYVTSIGEPPAYAIAAGLLLSVGLAWSTYLYIEQPFRHRFAPKAAAWSAVFGMIFIALSSAAFISRSGAVSISESTQAAGNAQFLEQMAELSGDCPFDVGSYSECYDLLGDAPASAILIGDSHAGHFVPGLWRTGRSVQAFILNGGCPPLLGVDRLVEGKSLASYANSGASCLQINHARIDYALRSPSPKVALAFTAPEYGSDELWYEGGENYKYSFDGDPVGNYTAMQLGLARTVEKLVGAGKKVVLFGDNPTLVLPNILHCLQPERPIAIAWPGGVSECAMERRAAERQRSRVMLEMLAAVERFPGQVEIFDTHQFLCDDDVCSTRSDGEVLY